MGSNKGLVHRGSKSWWTGDVKTLCGLIIPGRDAKSPWLTSPACPQCEAVLEARKRK
ncbi:MULTISPECIES: hypothetical protein [Amycolatopsis]|uniref:DUF3039 domain-containing protein n=1 Tax=Amycolatopsis thermalba TaxID=944492 RepID=A0ABY4NQ79_9PSEU|nr:MULTISPECIES: hypothetical protein [Amycolatopsis]UQS21754.1 hypothetical protein L1857_02400 [Amycolatopsis thermalba]